MRKLVKEVNVGYIRLSAVLSETVKRTRAIRPLTALEGVFIFKRTVEEHRIITPPEDLGIGFLQYSLWSKAFFRGIRKDGWIFFAKQMMPPNI